MTDLEILLAKIEDMGGAIIANEEPSIGGLYTIAAYGDVQRVIREMIGEEERVSLSFIDQEYSWQVYVSFRWNDKIYSILVLLSKDDEEDSKDVIYELPSSLPPDMGSEFMSIFSEAINKAHQAGNQMVKEKKTRS